MNHDTRLPPMAVGFAASTPQTRESLVALLHQPALADLFDRLPTALVLVGPDHAVHAFNTSAESLFGLRRTDVLGQPFERLREDSLLDLNPFLADLQRGRQGGAVQPRRGGGRFMAGRETLETGDGAGPWTLYHFAPVYQATQPRSTPTAQAAPLTLAPALERRAMQAAVALGRRLGVLLEGETGAGKSALARWIHDHSPRQRGPFIHVNCGGIPDSLFESELFGYERGAFTGALQGGKRGLIERAAGGTLCLDEVGEIPLSCQAKLLRFLEDGSLQPVGGGVGRRVEVAVLCATNRHLKSMVDAGTFRRDLYFRIAGFGVTVPALRESGLLPALIARQLEALNAERETPLSLSPATQALLLAHDYEGNVRELRNLLEHAAILATSVVEPEHLPAYVRERPASATTTGSLRAQVRALERRLIADALADGTSKREAARGLGIDVATLIRKARDD